jgi:hypothetical protein
MSQGGTRNKSCGVTDITRFRDGLCSAFQLITTRIESVLCRANAKVRKLAAVVK